MRYGNGCGKVNFKLLITLIVVVTGLGVSLVVGAENRPYTVIAVLEPLAASSAAGPGVWQALADAYDRTGRAGRAVKALVQYRRLNPQDAYAARELARQYAKMGDWRNAFDTARAAESLGATDLPIKLLRIEGGFHLAAGRRDSARVAELQKLSAELTEPRRAQPDQVGVRILQAVIATSLGKSEEAQSEMKRAAEECKEPLPAELQLARYYAQTKRLKEATGVRTAACERHPTTAEPWLALPELHLTNVDYDAARACLARELNGVIGNREKHSLSIKLVLVELVHGDRGKALALLQDLATRDPQEIQARALLLGMRETQGDRAATEKLLGELRQAEGEGGLWWRLYQASLWLSSKDWSAHQQDLTSSLRYCVDADPAWSAPGAVPGGPA